MSKVWELKDVGAVCASGYTLGEAFIAMVAWLQERDLEERLLDLRLDVDEQVLLTASFERPDVFAVAP